jgi:hypothetical protein
MYLKHPGALDGGYLVKILYNPRSASNITPWNISIADHNRVYRDVFNQRCQQFVPNIEKPIDFLEIENKLTGAESWEYPYALVIIHLERGNLEEALKYINILRYRFLRAWNEMAKEDLLKYYDLAQTDPLKLQNELKVIREKNFLNLTAQRHRNPELQGSF